MERVARFLSLRVLDSTIQCLQFRKFSNVNRQENNLAADTFSGGSGRSKFTGEIYEVLKSHI